MAPNRPARHHPLPSALVLLPKCRFWFLAKLLRPAPPLAKQEHLRRRPLPSAKGITDKDFELANRIEDAAMWRPAEGSAFEGFEKGFGKKWVR